MPIYEYRCSCGKISKDIRRVADRLLPQLCSCGQFGELIMSLPANSYISGYPYFDQVLDMEITDPAHRKKVLKQEGLEERG